MVGNELHRKFIGNVCLYRELADRVPQPFLRRNLTASLDWHTQQLVGAAGERPREAMRADERRRAHWQFPSPEMLEDLMQGTSPVLRINTLQLRELNREGCDRWQEAQHASCNENLEWLPDPRADIRLPCAVTISVAESRLSKRPVYAHSQSGLCIGRWADDGARYFDVTLDKPFLIELDSLLTASDSSTNGSSHWRRAMPANHMLEVSLQCHDSDDNAEFLSILESRDASDYHGRPANEASLRAACCDLLECPDLGDLLPLRRAKGHSTLGMRYGMAIDMSWSRREVPLKRYNQNPELASLHLSKPSSSEMREKSTPRVSIITYNLTEGVETRRHIAEGLRCIFCGRSPVFQSVDRLMFHYMMYHSHFDFHFDGKVTTAGDLDTISISLKVADKQSRSGALENPNAEHSWVAPDRPFDLSAYVSGDDTWISSSRSKSLPKRSRTAKPKEIEIAAAPTSLTSKKKPIPAEIPDLPRAKRKRSKVPNIAGVTFYHSLSKQPIKPGEELDESDDEVYDTRLAQSQRQNLIEHGLAPVSRDFHLAFNQHLDGEQPSTAREGIVRFIRNYTAETSNPKWQREFVAKLKHLNAHGAVGDDIVAYCLQLTGWPQQPAVSFVNGGDSSANLERSTPDTDGEGRHLNGPMDSPQSMNGTRSSKHDGNVDGRFERGNSHSLERVSISNEGADETSRSDISNPPRQKKTRHKWLGTGPDKEIIASGYSSLRQTSFGTEPVATETNSEQSDAEQSRSHSTPLQDKDSHRARQRYRWQDGQFLPRGEAVTPSREQLHSRGGVHLSNGTASPRMSNHYVRRPDSGNMDDDEIGVAPLTCRYIKCSRTTRPETVKQYRISDFAKLISGKQADDIKPNDLDFSRFGERLRRDFGFDPSRDKITLKDHGGDKLIPDGRVWRLVIASWQTSTAVPVFGIEPKSVAETMKPRLTAEAVEGQHEREEAAHPRRKLFGDAREKGVCTCGKLADGGRGCIACDNLNCARATFHLACVGLSIHTTGWRCDDCSTSSV